MSNPKYTLTALRKMQIHELETLIESAKKALENLIMYTWESDIYANIIANAETVLAEKESK